MSKLMEMMLASGEVELEEGEIFQPTKEMIAKHLNISISDLNEENPVSEATPDEVKADEVEVEDVTHEHYSTGQSSGQASDEQDLPDLREFFRRHSEEEIRRRTAERQAEGRPTVPVAPVDESAQQDWVRMYRDLRARIQAEQAADQPNYTAFHEVNRSKTGGRILSWAYLKDMDVYAVKREVGGVSYFKSLHDLKTLPYVDMRCLAERPLLYKEPGMISWFVDRLRLEARNRWKADTDRNIPAPVTKPQFGTMIYKPGPHGRLIEVRKYKAPRTMLRAPVRRMQQNFSRFFRWWYYDGRTHEAVIVLFKNGAWETIKLFDPLWIRNLSEKDVETLYMHAIFRNPEDNDQALLYDRVANICYVFDLHA